MFLLFCDGTHTADTTSMRRCGRRAKRVATREVALGYARLARMALGKNELVALRRQSALEEVGTELKDVGWLLLDDLAVQRVDLVGVIAG